MFESAAAADTAAAADPPLSALNNSAGLELGNQNSSVFTHFAEAETC